MPNYAYLSLWFHDGSPAVVIDQATKLFRLFPFSQQEPGFRSSVIRALDPSQPALIEQDVLFTVEEISSHLAEFFQADCAAELRAYWDLWIYDAREKWRESPSPVEFLVQGEQYDDGIFAENGHVQITLGLEHLFTGHAGILHGSQAELTPEQFTARAEYEFALTLQEPEMLEAYRLHTLENIRRVLAWERALWANLAIRRRRLWSEGESDLERSLDKILMHRASP